LLYRRGRSEIDLWPSQLDAATRALNQEEDLVVSLPTSAGKTMSSSSRSRTPICRTCRRQQSGVEPRALALASPLISRRRSLMPSWGLSWATLTASGHSAQADRGR
jgi:hypothetical protein